MRIGMATDCYKPVINGVTRMVSLYKQHLEAMGHEVTIFTLGEPDPAGEEPGVIRSPAVSLGDTGYYLGMRYTVAAQALLREMDIIHCHHLFISVELAHRYGRCPIVYTNHTRYDLYTGTYMPLPQPAADVLMRQLWPDFTDLADVVIVPSESVRQILHKFGVERPMVVIENGVDLRPFCQPSQPCTKTDLGISESAILLVYVGRLAAEKNVEQLLTQFAIAQELVPELELMMVGNGPLEDDLPELAAKLGVSQAVHFPGAIAYDMVGNYLAAADAFATASLSEVHPLTVVEAMAATLPIVAPASPGIVDTVVSGESGLLTSQPDGGLAAAMVALALDAPRRRQMGLVAQKASQRFDIGDTVARTVQLYEQLRTVRPDLQRERPHGRRGRNSKKLQPHLEQLTRILKSPEKLSTGALRRLFDLPPHEKEQRHDGPTR